jgi:tetratricopeptide (TPR) repeat protein
MRATLIALAGVLVAAPAQATPHDQLEQAGKAFQAHDWQSAKQIANDLLYPPPAQLGSQADVEEAYVILGASAFELGDVARARQEFENALKLDPDKILTTFTFSQGAVRLFEETRAELKTRAERDAERKGLAAREAQIELYLKNTRFVETHQYYLNFMPFGAGQFQNHDRWAGIGFATAEAATLATSLGIWFYLTDKYGINCPHCVATADAPGVLRMQQIEVVSAGAFFLVYGASILHALYHYQPVGNIQGDRSLLPPDLRTDEPAKKTSFRDRIHVGPILTPSGVGIGLGWEN